MNRIFVAAVAIGVGIALHAFAQQLSDAPKSPNADTGTGPGSSSQQSQPEKGARSAAPQSPIAPPSSDADDEKGSSSRWSYAPRGNDVLWASARNEHGALGQYCNSDMHFCVWILMLHGVACEEGGEHPVLLNTDRLATAQTLRCVGTVAGRGSTFAFTNFEDIDNAVRSAEQLAIAIPEEGDNIVVTHFPLAGAVAVLDRMRQVLAERGSSDDSNTPAGDAHNKPPGKTPTREAVNTRNTA